MAGLQDYLPMLLKLLTGTGAMAPITGPAMLAGGGGGQAQAAPIVDMGMTDRPPPVDPGYMPPQAPQPQPVAPAAPPPDIFPPAPAAAPPQAPGLHQGMLGRLLGLNPEISQMLRAAGAGMSNLKGNPYGDPFITAAQGFGGAQEYQAGQDTASAAAAVKADDTAYSRQKDAADREIRRMTAERQATSAGLTDQKTALEIRRLARSSGVTPDQYLRARAQAQADAAMQIIPKEDRANWIETHTQELLDNATKAGAEGQGLSGAGAGLSAAPTATGPNGEKVILRNGAWEPA